MIDIGALAIFIPTFFFVSITPGMCMTLAMTLGMSIGIRRTLWMMLGELLGVATVAVSAVLGVARIMLDYPDAFLILKWVGGAYLIYLGFNMCRAKGKMSIDMQKAIDVSRVSLFTQGFVTAIANPKGWAFMIALLPPFINVDYSVTSQLLVLLGIIMICEFLCMLVYASGGKSLRLFLTRGDNIKWLNRIAGSLMLFVGIWLALN